jgi:hypothetical protein
MTMRMPLGKGLSTRETLAADKELAASRQKLDEGPSRRLTARPFRCSPAEAGLRGFGEPDRSNCGSEPDARGCR